jgi:hypothetical protein
LASSQQLRSDVLNAIKELGDPDPAMRGDSKAGSDRIRRYDASRYATRFDLMCRRANIELRRALS